MVLNERAIERHLGVARCAFQKLYTTPPFDVPDPSCKKSAATLESDDGIRFSSAEGLATLKPVLAGGTVTLAGQTHPADGNAGIILAEPERAGQLSRDANICVRLHGFGSARAALAHMPEAPIPAAKRALDAAGVSIERMDAVKTAGKDEQFRLLYGVGPPAGADGHPRRD
jgi:acetyl-CoA C-acetyltransferase